MRRIYHFKKEGSQKKTAFRVEHEKDYALTI